MRRVPRDTTAAAVNLDIATREVFCATQDGTAQGPAAQLRASARGSRSSLLRRAYLRGREVIRYGKMDDGEPTGEWVQLDRLGGELGRYTLDAGTGVLQAWHGNGDLALTAPLRHGEPHGRWTYRFKGGGVAVDGQFVDGQRVGEWTWWYISGAPMRVVAFAAGQRHGLMTSWWIGGNKREEGRYVRGLRHGTWLTWNVDGELLGENRLREGRGHWVEWYRTGDKRAEGPMVQDKRQGPWREYYKSGAPMALGDYRANIRVRDTWRFFDEQGNARKRKVRNRQILGLLGRLSNRGGVAGGIVGGSFRGRGRVTGLGGLGRRGVGVTVRNTRTAKGGQVYRVTLAWTAHKVTGARLPARTAKMLRVMVRACLSQVRLPVGKLAPRPRGLSQGLQTVTATLAWGLDVRPTGRVSNVRRVTTPPGLNDQRALRCVDSMVQRTRFAPTPSGKRYRANVTATLYVK